MELNGDVAPHDDSTGKFALRALQAGCPVGFVRHSARQCQGPPLLCLLSKTLLALCIGLIPLRCQRPVGSSILLRLRGDDSGGRPRPGLHSFPLRLGRPLQCRGHLLLDIVPHLQRAKATNFPAQ